MWPRLVQVSAGLFLIVGNFVCSVGDIRQDLNKGTAKSVRQGINKQTNKQKTEATCQQQNYSAAKRRLATAEPRGSRKIPSQGSPTHSL
jgi:hypothetical protein